MEISNVSSDEFYPIDMIFEKEEESTEWNGREVKQEKTSENGRLHRLQTLEILEESKRSRMSRPDRGKAEMDAGYNDKDGFYVEGKFVLEWEFGKEDKENSNQKEPESGTSKQDVNSTDKN